MNLRPRQNQLFSGFTKAEVEKMERLFDESKEQSPEMDFYKNLARSFNWFEKKRRNGLLKETSFDSDILRNKATENPKSSENGENGRDISKLVFEARSSTDGAWYDVDTFISHRLSVQEVYVRYAGFGAAEDEWVNVNSDVRERSIALEHSECHKVNTGDLVVCFQERQDQARYYDARVISIQRRLHGIRGCRCLFLIRYNHDNTEERVALSRLCCRPNGLARMGNNFRP